MCFAIFDRFATDVMFQAENGDRSDVPNYLVIMTDGNSDNSTTTWNEAMRARARGINIITVSNSAHSCDVNCSWSTTFFNTFCMVNKYKGNKKAVLSQKMTARCALYMSVSYVSSQNRTRVKLNRVFFVRFSVSPKFPHVPLGVGGWPLGYEERS